MEEEKLLLTQRDRNRLKVLHEVRKGQLTQRQASKQLKLTDRWIRKLLLRMKERGDRVVVHGLRGRSSTRRISDKVEKRAVELVRREYADFGPTLASEYLEQHHGITVSRETLRKWMMRAGFGRGKSSGCKRSTFGENGGVASESWCSGTPASTTGWRGAGPRFT